MQNIGFGHAVLGRGLISSDTISWIIVLGWAFVSLGLCWVLGVFRVKSLASAPPRDSRLSLIHFGAAVLVYISVTLIAQSVVVAVHARSAKAQEAASQTAPAATAASASSPATATETGPATGSGTETSPATDAAETGPATAPADTAFKIQLYLANCLGPLAAAGLILVLARLNVVGGLRGFGVSLLRMPAGAGLGVLGAFALAPWIDLIQVATQLLSHMLRAAPAPEHPVLELVSKHPDPMLTWLLLISVVFVAPFFEELLFRGLLQTSLLQIFRMFQPARQPIPPGREAAHRVLVIVLTSLLFAGVHISLEGWQSMPPLFLLSVTLGYLYERTGNLWAPMTLHGCFNLVAFVVTLRAG